MKATTDAAIKGIEKERQNKNKRKSLSTTQLMIPYQQHHPAISMSNISSYF